ncbi:MAG: hypothetical protein NTY01_18550 [Verrucomicrobia bacterium]|nr:hypothetical protein [Verrucomicrobiota bacterium]
MNITPANKTVALLLALTAMALTVSCGKPADSPQTTGAPAVVPAAATAADFQPLIGRWARTDGDYMIEIKSITADGKAEAAYFNPRPINVARAEASRDGGALRLFMELRDSGYPGCLYKLTFDKAATRLTGTYFQAAQNETYPVTFEKAQ